MFNGDIPLFNEPVGPGSQRESDDGLVLDYMPMPKDMHTYDLPPLPESEELQDCPQALVLLERLQQALEVYRVGQQTVQLPLDTLPPRELRLLHQILGEGEVSILLDGEGRLRAQETVLAGVWWLHAVNAAGETVAHVLEVADVPSTVRRQAFAAAEPLQVEQAELPADVLNAPSVLVELAEAAQSRGDRSEVAPHVVNLSLLPFSPADHQCLADQLGNGAVTILSRGYGNCRISACAVASIWRVQYFNSGDQLILDTLEVTDMPLVACAAQEDIDDSAERLREIREALT